MNIISEKEANGRIIDGIKTILDLSDEDFDKILQNLEPKKGEMLDSICFYYTTDECECPNNKIQIGLEQTYQDDKFIGRSYFGVSRTSVHDILYQFQHLLPKFEIGSRNWNRCVQLLETRDLEAFKSLYNDGRNKQILDKTFEILSDEEAFYKFLDFKNNEDYFSINGEQVDISEYLKYLGSFFGAKNSTGRLNSRNTISMDFYIPELEKFKERYSQILDTYNLDRYTNPTYEFKRFTSIAHITDRIIKEDEEPEWVMNPELRETVYEGFPEDGSLEEQAMHIYCKLCGELEYDEGYFYRKRLSKDRYSPDFSKEHLESIAPHSKITCWDFSRIFRKLINELDGDIEAVVIGNGMDEGHYLTGFYTDKVSLMLEAINGKSEGTNDILKAKLGLKFEGFEIISDRNGVIEEALDTVYPRIFGRPQIRVDEYLDNLRRVYTQKNNLEENVESFIEFLKSENLSGNEAMQMLNICSKLGFLGDNIQKAFIGKEKEDGFERLVAITTKNGNANKPVYIVQTQSLEISKETMKDLQARLDSGELVYEDEKHKLPDIDEEAR